MEIQEFVEAKNKLENFYKKEMTKEQTEEWYKDLKNIDIDTFKRAINNLAKKNKFMPTLSEVRKEIPENNIQRINLNSSYWYINLRQWCDENKQSYYNITTGEPLSPYKE